MNCILLLINKYEYIVLLSIIINVLDFDLEMRANDHQSAFNF